MNAREIAFHTLKLCEKERQFSNIAVTNAIERYCLAGQDRDLYTRLVYGVIEKRLSIDYLIQQYTGKPVRRLDVSVLVLLRLSLYQIYFCDKIPESAAVSESVKLAGRYASRAKGFVNGVLRQACRERKDLPACPATPEELSVRYSVDVDICRLLQEQYPDEYREILSSYEKTPLHCLNVNALFMSPAEFMEKTGLPLVPCEFSPTGVRLTRPVALSSAPFLEKGWAFVQDEASQLTALALDPAPGDVIIDVCACPGGKSFAAVNWVLSKHHENGAVASFMPKAVYSMDCHVNKLSLVKSGALRLGYPVICTVGRDGRDPDPALLEKADRVICDVPCSGLGFIAKKPEIRYKDSADIQALPQLQYEILHASSGYVKSGGVLLYSTCTINRKENEEVMRRFLNEHTDFHAVDFCFRSLKNGNELSSQNGCMTLLPCDVHDGFFIAKTVRQ